MTLLAKDFVLNAALYLTSSMSAGNGSPPQEGINPTSSRAHSHSVPSACVWQPSADMFRFPAPTFPEQRLGGSTHLLPCHLAPGGRPGTEARIAKTWGKTLAGACRSCQTPEVRHLTLWTKRQSISSAVLLTTRASKTFLDVHGERDCLMLEPGP